MTGKPLQLLYYNAHSKRLEITKEAKDFLTSLKEDDIHVVIIVGAYRTGKSFLLNRLRGSQQGFELGDGVYGCTKGIWIWGEPVRIDGKTFLLLDTEGLGDFERDKDYDVQIFALSILLSSTLIFNKMSVIDERSIRELELVLDISKTIKFQNSNTEDSDRDLSLLAQTFPRFYLVIRDFFLQLKNKDGAEITSDQYFEDVLTNTSKNETNNQIKNYIKTCFPKRRCFTLPRPIEG